MISLINDFYSEIDFTFSSLIITILSHDSIVYTTMYSSMMSSLSLGLTSILQDITCIYKLGQHLVEIKLTCTLQSTDQVKRSVLACGTTSTLDSRLMELNSASN